MYVGAGATPRPAARRAVGHDPERRAEGVHRARHVHLSAAPLAADRHRHLRLVRPRAAELEPDLDQRLPHPRGRRDRRAGSRVHAGQRRSPTSRRRASAGLDVDRVGQRLSFFFAAHNDFIEEIAKFRAARRLWAYIMRDRFGATAPACHAAPLPHADGRQHPDRPAARQQHRPGGPPGDGGRARRHPVAALQRPRRGAGASDRGIGSPRAAHAADHRGRNRRRRARSTRSAAPGRSRRETDRIEREAQRAHR